MSHDVRLPAPLSLRYIQEEADDHRYEGKRDPGEQSDIQN